MRGAKRWALAALLSVAGLAGRAEPNPDFKLGLEVFLAGYTQTVKGQRLGLITNQTGRNARGASTIDLLYRHPELKLVALFAAEHGIRGQVLAGEHVANARDESTGLTVYSLYGLKGHRPTPDMLDRIDVLVYDMQDVGSRAYTYVWTMAECMAACAQAGKRFLVLDRPNPLVPNRIDGPIVEARWLSFIGLYPVPRVYGLTAGELALYLNGEHRLGCRLTVVPMAGYRRSSTWEQTGLTWVPSSPNIPSPESAICFAATGTIGTLGTLEIGIGGRYPFQMVGAPWIDAEVSASILNGYKLPGVKFLATKPYLPPGGPARGKETRAIFLWITDPAAFLPCTTELAILSHLGRQYPGKLRWDPATFDAFDKAMGTSTVRQTLMRGGGVTEIMRSWRPAQEQFVAARAKYLIYP